jgi:hypothetical protein
MGKKVFVLVAGLAILLTLGACKKKDERPIPSASPPPGISMPTGPSQVVVPDYAKDKWNAVKLSIEDKMANESKDVVIKLGEEYAIPGSNLKVKVKEFLPDFIMDGMTITSKSVELNNPAVKVIVSEGGKELFDNWLYSKFPAIHPFQHEQYGLILIEPMKEG